MKADYVRECRLGGLFYWTATGDAKGGRSLIETGYNTLHNL
jgi:chitinase